MFNHRCQNPAARKRHGMVEGLLSARRRGCFPAGMRPSRLLSGDERWEIICAYFKKLERMSEAVGVDADLPYPKELIEKAIFREILENPACDLRNQLEIAYVQLESFISHREYMILRRFKEASTRLQQIAETGDPVSIINSAKMVDRKTGDRAVEIQERISERTRQKLAKIQAISKRGHCREEFPVPGSIYRKNRPMSFMSNEGLL